MPDRRQPLCRVGFGARGFYVCRLWEQKREGEGWILSGRGEKTEELLDCAAFRPPRSALCRIPANHAVRPPFFQWTIATQFVRDGLEGLTRTDTLYRCLPPSLPPPSDVPKKSCQETLDVSMKEALGMA